MKIHFKNASALALATLVISTPVMADITTTYTPDVLTTLAFLDNLAYTNEAALQVNQSTLELVRNRDDKKFNGYDVWFAPVKTKNTKDNAITSTSNLLRTGNHGADLNLKGFSFGIEKEFDHRQCYIGALGNIGKIDVDTKGLASRVSNDIDYYSMGLYGKFRLTKKLTLQSDLLLSRNSNEIKAGVNNVPATDNMGSFHSDVNTNIISGGLQLTYRKHFKLVNLYPHVGARYTVIKSDEKVSVFNSYGNNVANIDSERIKFASIPFGLTLSKNFMWGDVLIAPKFDVTCTYNFFDTYEKNAKVTFFNNINIKSELIEKFGYNATIGVDVQYKSFDFGLNASFGKDSDTDRSAIFANIGYAF